MRKIGFLATVGVLLTCMPVAPQTSRKQPEPCPVENSPSGWQTYVDRSHGFCFSYPLTYTRIAQPWLKIYTNAPDKSALKLLRKAAQQHRLLRLQSKQDTGAVIIVSLEDEAFNLEGFVAGAPTGIEGPPELKQMGPETFYYYGPGGGGVDYADEYFFDLKGKTLLIIFDGPYINDKTPSPETKDLEERLLRTFRAF